MDDRITAKEALEYFKVILDLNKGFEDSYIFQTAEIAIRSIKAHLDIEDQNIRCLPICSTCAMTCKKYGTPNEETCESWMARRKMNGRDIQKKITQIVAELTDQSYEEASKYNCEAVDEILAYIENRFGVDFIGCA